VKLESHVLMTERIRVMAKVHPKSYPLLGRYFDDVHPIIFGNKTTCNHIADSLGKDAQVISSKALSDFIVVRLNAECNLNSAKRKCSDWLVGF
jgi:hypothetical protein